MREAHKLFDEMGERDYGHTKLGQVRRARLLFDEMPDKSIVSCTQ